MDKNSKKEPTLKVFEAFAGIGAQVSALNRTDINYEIVGISEWFIDAIECYAAIHCDGVEVEMPTDIKEIDDYLSRFTFSATSVKATNIKRLTEDQRRDLYRANKQANNYGSITDIKGEDLPEIDLLIYSLAAPVRMDESTGTLYRSSLKPIGKKYNGIGVDFLTEELLEVSIDPANEDDIKSTVKVMGGEDWKLWTDALLNADLLAENAINVAYSYIGPEMTKAVYREGTIGKAKDHLEATAHELDKEMQDKIKGHAYVSVNKAVVTRSSAVIPTVPLYIGILFKVMKNKGIHEGCIEQMYRLLNEKLYNGGEIPVDSENRIRLDDWELREDVQKEVLDSWNKLTKDNLKEIADLALFRKDYMNMHGFDEEGIDYSQDVQI